MRIVKQVTMLVPSELLYAFDPDAANIFVIARERGRLVARPLSEYQNLPECSRYKEGYNDGFEDGIAKGYNDALKEFEAKFDEDLVPEDYEMDDPSEEYPCDSLCINCPWYDDMSDRCRHHACCLEGEE